MAALCPGNEYGLSSQKNFSENKDLIFVKLTDSAIRAIEEYIKNQNKFSHNPTIKFLGNENGELAFPSLHNDHAGGAGSGNGHGATHFRFTMSSTADMEGQGGSFECIKQSPRGPLEGLGSIPWKLRVHANDDSFGATKHRMAEVEDKYKNKCTREIKPNQTDIGRKVKVKQTNRPLSNIRRDVPQPVTSMRDALLKTSTPYSSNQPPVIKPHQSQPTVHSSTPNGFSHLLSNGLGSNHVSSSRPQPCKKPSQPDIAKRPLKERLIHLLAMKPFKKLELHERLNKEGLREKNSIASVLKQVAIYRDNCYHLNPSFLNEVKEDWSFYTDSERQMMKRRKPQNLTPPGGSDGGSSGSGQSPTSTHPGSPPPPVSSTQNNKRPGFRDGADAFPYKKQRIAHTNRPPPSNSQPPISTTQLAHPIMTVDQPYKLPAETNSLRRPVTDSRDTSNMNPRSRESPTSGYPPASNGPNPYAATNGISSMTPSLPNDKRSLSDEEDDEVARSAVTKKRSCDSFGVQPRNKPFMNGGSGLPLSPVNTIRPVKETVSADRYSGSATNIRQQEERERQDEKYNKERIARVSPDSQTDSIPNVDLELKMDEFPDYQKLYVTIQDPEQRRRYKTDFNADYAEYRDLHGVVEKVSKRFAQLEERLKQENENSPKYKDIKNMIVREYRENKKDHEHQRAKKRFQYLHEKLSHIKQLVLEYDQSVTADGGRY